MNQFNLGNFLSKVVNYSLQSMNGGAPQNAPPNQAAANQEMKFQAAQNVLTQQSMIQNSASQYAVAHTFSPSIISDLKMNNIETLDRSLYVKDLLNLPKEMEEVLVLVQNKTVVAEEAAELLTTNINLAQLTDMILKNGKDAMSKLIIAMANASKQGITDLSQIKETIRYINASVSVASQENSSQVLKNFMLLYLPWLPLPEGADFELELPTSGGEEADSEATITILISTRNYGNVKATLILVNGNSVSVFINCSDKFPKDELLKRIKVDTKSHSIQSEVIFEQQAMKQDENAPIETKVSLSGVTEVNPSLILMANLIIRNVIQLDIEAG